jgi:hypothetical protein
MALAEVSIEESHRDAEERTNVDRRRVPMREEDPGQQKSGRVAHLQPAR